MLSRFGAFLRSSIGKKSLMAVTGLLLIGFLILHVAGNLTLYADRDGATFQEYAHKTHSFGILLKVGELGLVALFVMHIVLAMRTALENREARPVRYKDVVPKGNRTIASVSMLLTGVVVLVFLVIHLLDFRLAEGLSEPPAPERLFELVIARLTSPLGAAIYLIAMVFLGLHLRHAFQSALQTLGLRHPAYAPAIRAVGITLAVVIAGLFATFPILCMAFEGRWPWSS